ncbi:hypothetical protein NEOLEDRAFT_1141939, partial [Neolentinus lepideus HHB14362 ss-1]
MSVPESVEICWMGEDAREPISTYDRPNHHGVRQNIVIRSVSTAIMFLSVLLYASVSVS